MLNSQIKFNKNISVTDSSIFLLLLKILDQKKIKLYILLRILNHQLILKIKLNQLIAMLKY